MSTVACMDWILAAWVLTYSISSAWVADFNGAVLICRSTLRERNRQPVRGRTIRATITARYRGSTLMRSLLSIQVHWMRILDFRCVDLPRQEAQCVRHSCGAG